MIWCSYWDRLSSFTSFIYFYKQMPSHTIHLQSALKIRISYLVIMSSSISSHISFLSADINDAWLYADSIAPAGSHIFILSHFDMPLITKSFRKEGALYDLTNELNIASIYLALFRLSRSYTVHYFTDSTRFRAVNFVPLRAQIIYSKFHAFRFRFISFIIISPMTHAWWITSCLCRGAILLLFYAHSGLLLWMPFDIWFHYSSQEIQKWKLLPQWLFDGKAFW